MAERCCPTCRQPLPKEVLDFFKRGRTHNRYCVCDACSGNVTRALRALAAEKQVREPGAPKLSTATLRAARDVAATNLQLIEMEEQRKAARKSWQGVPRQTKDTRK